jgi:pimeloyl-ACP methyl ester carboxylesterase
MASAATANSGKPRILMLHGGGTSGSIFTIQTRKVIWALRKYFDFAFLDAPWVCPPGPGVLPVFADAGPFYRWARWYDDEDGNKVKKALRNRLSEPGGPWVGVLGFSQGGRLAAGLLWQQENGGLDDLLPELNFKFGVFVGSGYPLLHLTHEAKGPASERESKEWDPKYEHGIHVPSVHAIGKQDPVAPFAKLMFRCFDPNATKMLEPDTGHQMPLDDTENYELCQAIIDAYKQGGGQIEGAPEKVGLLATKSTAEPVMQQSA